MESSKKGLPAEKGYKNTKSRKAIMEVLETAELPVTAEEIHINIREKGFSTNLSTVYRTLELLESRGLIEKSAMLGSKSRYQLVCEGHRHHVVCTGCHRMITLEGCPLGIIEKKIGETTKFDITGHKLEIYGLCPKCRKS